MKFNLFQSDDEEPGLPLTPLIDIIFILLIFYISISRMNQADSQLSVRIPTASAGETPSRTIGDVVINVGQDGTYLVNNQNLDAIQLRDRLARLAAIVPGQSVIIRSDGQAAWDAVCAVLDACALADIWNIKFAVLPEKSTAGQPAAP
jgi:biopolymer transport protein ExbD